MLNKIQTKTINQVLFSNILFNSIFIIIIILSVLNWVIEIKKWQYINRISFKRATRESLIGHALGSVTPLKIGDYYIKTRLHKKSNKKTILKNNLKSNNIYQLTSTVFFGVIGCLYLLKVKSVINEFHIIGLITVLTIITLSFYSKIQPHLNRLLTYSFLKHLIFSSQFIILVHLVSHKLNFEIIAIAHAMYLLSSMIPVISIFDISIKGSVVAVFIFNIYKDSRF